MKIKYNLAVMFISMSLVAGFYYRQIFLGQVFYCCDNLLINIPSKLFLIAELRQGRFPFWNPYIFSGSPFLADINLALFYPLNILYFFLPPFQALTAGVVLDVFLGIFGMYSLCRRLRCSAAASILAGIVFGFSGTMVTYTNNIPMLQVASLAPWLLWAWKRFFDTPSLISFLGIVLIASLQVLAGHPQLTYYIWLLAVVFVLFTCSGKIVFKIGLLGAVAFLTFLVTGIQTVPFMEFVMLSTRVGRGFGYASFDSLHPLNIIRLLLPNVIGVLREGTAWAQGGSVYGYIGAIALLFAYFAHVRFWKIIAGLAFLLALGKYTPFFWFIYLTIPGVSGFRSPQHFLLLFTIAASVLAAYGFDDLKSGRIRKIGELGMAEIILGGLMYLFSQRFVGLVLEVSRWYPTRVLEKLHGFAPAAIETVVRLSAFNIFMVGILMATTGLVWKRSRNAVVLLVFLELFLFSQNGFVSIDLNVPMRWMTMIHERVNKIAEPSGYPYPGKKQFGVFDWAQESAWQVSILRPNLNMVAELPTEYGYASLVYRDYQAYTGKASDPTGVVFDDPTGEKITLLKGPKIFLTGEGNNDRNIKYLSMSSNEVTISVETEYPAALVYLNTNYPGWRAWVDGTSVPITRYKNIFQSVGLEKGRHTVRFLFDSESVRWGIISSVFGVAIYIFLFFRAITKIEVPHAGSMTFSNGKRIGEKRLNRRI
ncbi:YfhO family protein [Candidatus Gottesmanbacteria bacterium]|nr:YfhO family protein [Candidatus Gottesmanbacteria bacterium]